MELEDIQPTPTIDLEPSLVLTALGLITKVPAAETLMPVSNQTPDFQASPAPTPLTKTSSPSLPAAPGIPSTPATDSGPLNPLISAEVISKVPAAETLMPVGDKKPFVKIPSSPMPLPKPATATPSTPSSDPEPCKTPSAPEVRSKIPAAEALILISEKEINRRWDASEPKKTRSAKHNGHWRIPQPKNSQLTRESVPGPVAPKQAVKTSEPAHNHAPAHEPIKAESKIHRLPKAPMSAKTTPPKQTRRPGNSEGKVLRAPKVNASAPKAPLPQTTVPRTPAPKTSTQKSPAPQTPAASQNPFSEDLVPDSWGTPLSSEEVARVWAASSQERSQARRNYRPSRYNNTPCSRGSGSARGNGSWRKGGNSSYPRPRK
ncbi:hypothetical protein K490DRAFT_65160 [Saccharata proteae CBS 121410]|uniref:Uncharacterized protein n=1 Tax=Saccharata proteae CBS 121410 TaxID=1314787 RepID=A0A9P4HWV2_9PEZI|nr:hypothetical protein K490DRAFT_65160 [Saccharata proteae CBS 121410]